MAKHFATFTGIIDVQDAPAPEPPGVPTHPIALPGDPNWGQIPGFGGPGGGLPIGPGAPGYPVRPQPQPPLGIWGPNDPRPTNPIAGWNPATGGWPTPQPPWQPQPPGSGGGQPPVVSQPIAGVPGPGGQLVFFYSPMYGVVAVPASGSWADFLPQPVQPPKPVEPPTEPGTGAPEPPVA